MPRTANLKGSGTIFESFREKYAVHAATLPGKQPGSPSSYTLYYLFISQYHLFISNLEP